VGDEAHVRLVDAHAEGDGGHHDDAVLVDEAGLVLLARGGIHAGVVRQRGETLGIEPGRHLVHLPARQAVDDTGLAGVALLDEAQQLFPGAAFVDAHVVADVGAVEAGDEMARVFQLQAPGDLLAGGLIRRGGEGDARHLGKALVQNGKLHVFRPEVVAPLGHAMGLVDGEQGGPDASQNVQEAVRQQALRRHIEQVQLASQQVALHPARRIQGQGGIEDLGLDPELFQGRHLVLHEGDEGRNDDAGAGARQGGKLVAQGLAAAGGHEHQGVATVDEMTDDGFLMGPEFGVAEDRLQQ
jgi:hypothetical protein